MRQFLEEPPLWFLVVGFVAGIVLLLKGADWLVDGAVAIARRWGVSVLLIGLTIVAFGTSAPELAVNVIAAVNGNADLSFGNIVGSNIANIGLVVGLGALVAPLAVHGRVIKIELPWLVVISFAMLAMAYIPTELGADAKRVPGFSPVDGGVMLVAFLGFCLFWYRMGKRDARDPLAIEAREQAQQQPGNQSIRSWSLVLLGLAGLVAGGKGTEYTAVGFAERAECSKTLIGLTIVAVATSLPEVFTVLAAARKGHTDLAVGNVVGSNVFNILLVLAVTAVIAGVPLPAYGLQDLLMMLAMTGLLLAVAWTRRRIVGRLEGVVLLLVYAAYMAWSVWREYAAGA
ncbi:MAG: calcium/sodium antiporter [Planctomycetota bacterium]